MTEHDIKTMFGRKVAIDASMRYAPHVPALVWHELDLRKGTRLSSPHLAPPSNSPLVPLALRPCFTVSTSQFHSLQSLQPD